MTTSQLPLADKRALVLGAGSAAGRTIAVALATAGADVAVATASLDGDEVMAARRTRRAVEAAGRRSTEYAFDVTLGQNVQVSTRQVAKWLGGLDILVWAVSTPLARPADKITDAEWSRALAINLSGAFFACRAALREMLADAWGRIILVTGQPGSADTTDSAAVLTARFGLFGLASALAGEYGTRGIQAYVVNLAPPHQESTPAGSDHEGAPVDLADLAVFLATDAPARLNGSVLPAVVSGAPHQGG